MTEIWDDYKEIVEIDMTEDGIITAVDIFDYVGIYLPINA